jgi:hypothetical protein
MNRRSEPPWIGMRSTRAIRNVCRRKMERSAVTEKYQMCSW